MNSGSTAKGSHVWRRTGLNQPNKTSREYRIFRNKIYLRQTKYCVGNNS
jgi:hypothetical protein